MEYLSRHLEHCGFSSDELASAASRIPSGGTWPAGFLEAPADAVMLERVQALARVRRSPELAGVIVAGIGGSSLGALAVAGALPPDRELLVADTTDPSAIRRIMGAMRDAAASGKHYLLLIVSKSGSTTETVANAAVLVDAMKQSDADWQKHVIVVTDEGSPLAEHARAQGYEVVAVSGAIGGRFSIFTPIGLLPLALAGVDIAALARGAVQAQASCLDRANPERNPALLHAAAAYLHAQQGRNIHTLFLFAPALAGLGAWWGQLVGESLGKDGKGMMPVVSIGSSDLHTLGQRYFGGSKDVFTTFISAGAFSDDPAIPSGGIADLVPDVGGKTLGGILNAICQGVKASYQTNGLPYAEHTLETVSAENIGALMQALMMEIVYTAWLMGVDPYTQPAVEAYKAEVRRILNR